MVTIPRMIYLLRFGVFIDLSHLKDGAAIEAGVYAVIESANPNEAREEQNISKIVCAVYQRKTREKQEVLRCQHLFLRSTRVCDS